MNEPDEQHMAQHVRQARLEALLGTVHGETMHLPAWLRPTRGEHRLPVLIAVLAIIAVQLRMPAVLAMPPRYLLPAVEAALVVGLTVMSPTRIARENMPARVAGLVLFAAAALYTAYTAGRLVYLLATGNGGNGAQGLICITMPVLAWLRSIPGMVGI